MSASPQLLCELSKVTVIGEGGRRVLRDIHLQVPPGGSLALIGHVGGGKTTVLRLIAGLQAPTSGRVMCLGADVQRLDYKGLRRMRLRLGFFFEAMSLWANQTIFENIALPLRYHQGHSLREAEVVKRVERMGDELGIYGHLYRPTIKVNSAVRKRALAARALILEPMLLLCDEPQVGLTPEEAAPIAAAIHRRLKKRNMGVVIADHDGYLEPYGAEVRYYIEDGEQLSRPSGEPPPDRTTSLGLPEITLGGNSVLGGRS